MKDFSVAIRTYNGAARLPAVLEGLRRQINTEHLSWEIVIVDNNSTDSTRHLIEHYQQTGVGCPLRYVFEPQQGASFARQRAISAAKGRWIGFLDDDNIPANDWVSAAYQFGLEHPYAAAVGSQIHPCYEVPPPDNFERIASFIPIIERDEAVCFTAGWRAMSNLVPPGAGLAIRRDAWQQHVPTALTLKGPVGASLNNKGEDVESLLHLKKAGWEIWFNPDMHIEHQIPRHRFERQYLLDFFWGIGLSKSTTRMVPYPRWQRPFMTGLYLLNDLKKTVRHIVRYRQNVHRDLVAACELQLLLSSLWGPFYSWKQRLISAPDETTNHSKKQPSEPESYPESAQAEPRQPAQTTRD